MSRWRWPVALIYVFGIVLFARASSDARNSPRIAVVGAGMAGASAAYHLSKAPCNATLHVFEADRVGGRARELTYRGVALELGASIIWEYNYLLADMAQTLGLGVEWKGSRKQEQGHISGSGKTAVAPGTETQAGGGSMDGSKERGGEAQVHGGGGDDDDDYDGDGPDEGMAIWDGSKFVLNQTSSLLDTARVLWRYGSSPLVYGHHAYSVWRDHFKRIYELQDKGRSFTHPEDLLKEVGLWDLTQAGCEEDMKASLSHFYVPWGSDRFRDELAGAISRCNYNQRPDNMNALAGLISFIPAAGSGRCWSVKGGNSQLASGMIEASRAKVFKGARVTRIERSSSAAQYYVSVQNQGAEDGADKVYGPYDGVVLAAPQELSGIQIDLGDGGSKGASLAAGPRKFQRTVTTYVIGGELQPEAFGVGSIPSHVILVSASAPPDFSAIAGRRVKGEHVYKVFSEQPLLPALLTRLFGANATILEQVAWDAYPKFSPPEQFAPFELAPGLCYTSALENAASAMEVAALAGRNCALLLSSTVVVADGQVSGLSRGAMCSSTASTAYKSADDASSQQHLVVEEAGREAAAAA